MLSSHQSDETLGETASTLAELGASVAAVVVAVSEQPLLKIVLMWKKVEEVKLIVGRAVDRSDESLGEIA